MSEDKPILSSLQSDSELMQVHLYFQDPDVDEALSQLIRLVAKPNVPPQTAAPLIVQLQALSSKFQIMGKVHMLFETEDTKEARTRKKNTLLTLSAELEKLANAVKYLVK